MLAGVAPANAESPSVTISASATAGAAPLTVTFEARGDAASYRWQLGNGQTAEGLTASATYGPGLWTVTVTATAADGATTHASVTVRSVAVTLLPPPVSRYGRPVAFQGRVVPALAGEPGALYIGGREGGGGAGAHAAAGGPFELRPPRVRTPGPYEARTPVAASAPVALRLHPVLRATFVGARAVGGRLALTARVSPAGGGTFSIRLSRDGRLVRHARAGAAARLGVATNRIAGYRAIVRVEPANGWLGAVRVVRADVLCVRDPPGDVRGDGLVFEYYPGAGYQSQPLLSFAALDGQVSQLRCRAARRLASALLARAVRIGDAVYWEYDFPYQGGPVPWRSGFAQAVAAQALARAGAFLRDPVLSAVAAASFRGLRQTLLMGIAGGYWVREYSFTDEVILNAQLQSIISIESYAAVAKSAAARDLARKLAVAARRLLPRFDLG